MLLASPTAAKVALLAGAFASSSAFYLPGVAPIDYEDGARVDLKVNKLTSTKTQLPYEWYSLPFCRPAEVVTMAENLGEVMRGDKIENSPYEIHMHKEETCKVLCRMVYTTEQILDFSSKVSEDYRVNWIVDNLPAATRIVEPATTNAPARIISIYERGFPLGFKGSADIPGTKPGVNYLYNHHRIVFKYHTEPQAFDGARLVGFEVEPFSVKHSYEAPFERAGGSLAPLSTCGVGKPVTHTLPAQPADAAGEVIWTYDVSWEYSDVKWASRWDVYLYATDEQIHWFSIVNSFMIVLFLTGMLAMIMLRTLHRDLRRYNDAEAKEEAAEESGWKLVHGDVFRPPKRAALLSVYVGTGVQVLAMTVVTMFFAVFGFLSPSNRGALMTAMILLFTLMGALGGLVSARLYKAMNGSDWRTTTLKTAFMFPGIVFGIFFALNLLIWGQKSSGAVPFSTLLALLVMWFCISVPLVYLGSYFGYRMQRLEFPTKTNLIPRSVPTQAWYTHPVFSVLVGGVLPFGAVFIELFFILSSIWLHQYYYVFGFLLIVFIILIITCAEITIVMCYFQLCAEDYDWWWRAFLTSGSSGLYLFAYSLVYMATKMVMTRGISILLYVGYMLIMAYSFFMLTGAVGFLACFAFVRAIYGAVKVE
uniref:Transmembrane 9 superfamily member n=1 Tax=Chrysotila carterae TaxID=13221 RepID=A0A7S4BFB6_CHRCT|mmetsp:Transcript_38705/g.85032  ORF Transcript_38705/g.85032 Transcript_38705/m.85032 type:complete len:648 (+) Transcript_38705:90-2033(+)